MISDAQQRREAIDVKRSCIVQAPAGSGKTELLIQRMLALLGQVDRVEEILAITFTNKAAAEMRERILLALVSAQQNEPQEEHKRLTWRLACAVIKRHGDSLLDNPSQLNIQTIDSFNAALVRRMPWLSRFGSVPQVSDDAELLYRQAIDNLCRRLSTGQGEQSQALQILLAHLDNQLSALENLLVGMLKRRDQWLEKLWHDSSRSTFEGSLEQLCRDELTHLNNLLPQALSAPLMRCARSSADYLDRRDLLALLENGLKCDASDMPGWLYIADLLLTAKGDLRKKVDKRGGFPATAEHKDIKQTMLQLLDDCKAYPDFCQQLKSLRELPKPCYSDDQWCVLQSLILLLPELVAELWLVFRSRSQVDFIEIALKALNALGAAEEPSELLLQIDHSVRHILIDEFQDTSRLQQRLLKLLTAGWSADDDRSLFLVGDPMQSIYRFREADVGLFLRCFHATSDVFDKPIEALKLTSNFRSQKGVVDWVNSTFTQIFPPQADLTIGAVPASPAVAECDPLPGEACSFYPFAQRNDRAEAEQVVALIKEAQAEDLQQSIAILVRGRNHLNEIMPLLREHAIPYQARDIDLLATRPAALDIVHLTRALMHRADQLSWLAVLRGPWCGLVLTDLELIFNDQLGTVPTWLLDSRNHQLLSIDGQQRIGRVAPVLLAALEQKGRLPLRLLIESCWLSLGAQYCYDEQGLNDSERVFDLLDSLDEGGELKSFESLDRSLERLFAEADAAVEGTVQVMTIHKAKGLEFDQVIVPGLGRKPRHQDSPLLRWFDHPRYGLMLAPITARGEQEQDLLYRYLGGLEKEKDRHESARLLYVAATRAIKRLHLLGHAEANSDGDFSAASESLLEKLWPQVGGRFTDARMVSVISASEEGEICLRRLPADWQPPQLSSLQLHHEVQYDVPTETASSKESSESFLVYEDTLPRNIGTQVHLLLEDIANRGIDWWLQGNRIVQRQQIGVSLTRLGVESGQLDEATNRVCRSVDRCLAGRRGQWILQNHKDSRTEMALSGVIEGGLVHAVVDRSFIDDGERWVIDYKTSQPRDGQSLDTFYFSEAERYKKQLDIYAQLFRMIDPQTPVRSALYFPMLDGWYVLT